MSVAKILLVDDNNADISLLRMALDGQDEKYELEILRSGEEAIRYIQQHSSSLREPDPCVIILRSPPPPLRWARHPEGNQKIIRFVPYTRNYS